MALKVVAEAKWLAQAEVARLKKEEERKLKASKEKSAQTLKDNRRSGYRTLLYDPAVPADFVSIYDKVL
jgi:hypothetical protein